MLVPVYASAEPETQALLDVLASRGYVVRTLRNASQVDLARSTLATEALRDGFKETFWIDADQVFDPDDVDRIRKLNRPLVCGLYSCKGPKRLAGKFMPDAGKVKFGKGGGLVEIEFGGMGFCCVRAEVYRAMEPGLPRCSGGYEGKDVVPYFIPMLTGDAPPCYLSEDYSFFARARQVGYPLICDTRIKVGHVGKKTYTWDDLQPDRPLESLEVEMGREGKIELTSATPKGPAMQIIKDELLQEQACLDQQEAQAREEISNAQATMAEASSRLQSIHGAKQLLAHLVRKIEAKTPPEELAAEEDCKKLQEEFRQQTEAMVAKNGEATDKKTE